MSRSRLGVVLSILLSAIFPETLAQRPEWLAPRLGAEQRTGTMLLGMGAARHQNTPFVTPQETALHSFSGACPQGMDSPDARATHSVSEQRREALRTRIEVAGTPPQIIVGGTS